MSKITIVWVMYANFDRPFTFDRVVRLIISTFLIFLGIYVIYVLRSVLLPFLLAWLIAYILNPIVRIVQSKIGIKNRILAVTFTLLIVGGVIAGIIALLIPLIEDEIDQINQLVFNYQNQLRSLNININGVPVKIQDFILNNIDFNKLRSSLTKESATETVQYLIPTITGVVSRTISLILSIAIVFIVMLYLIFILIDYDKINELWRNLIPHRYRPLVNKVVLDVEKSMNTYFRNQFFICLILSVLYATGFQLIGLPLAIILGIFVGLLHMIPYFQVVSFIPALLLCWLKASQADTSFWAMLGLVALVYVVVQIVLELFLTPRIMGRAMGLNPAIILLSLSVWGYLLGFVGMIIAIPLTTLLLSYYQAFINSDDDGNGQYVIKTEIKVEEDIKITDAD
ncbi:AI-2E family transporter [Dysgonomonas sp. 216]|uniref:AI-2E family transporter n=1 Tax=Dysgonomonas sp. 216 TaxID=2302934 RepID=UPI0021028A6A|nr:AI-2E family transporter [Dysgonomonas sp. 216]